MLRAKLPSVVQEYVLQPYISWAQKVVRFKTDVVMLTHLILYFTTLVPSACLLFYRFSWIHGFLHWILQLWYCGAFTLMKHQHIHMNGVLSPRYYLFDTLFPYLLDPLLGHTWNSYYYHHIKHHHVEGNGPDDLSTTMWYDRDSVFDFACYVGRFFFSDMARPPKVLCKKRPDQVCHQGCLLGTEQLRYDLSALQLCQFSCDALHVNLAADSYAHRSHGGQLGPACLHRSQRSLFRFSLQYYSDRCSSESPVPI